jgi:hypothetical protein
LAAFLFSFFLRVHVVLEAHEHGESAHTEHHDHESDHDHDHSPHPVADHHIDDATACLGKAEQLLVHDLVTVAELVLAPIEEASPAFGWIEDRGAHGS